MLTCAESLEAFYAAFADVARPAIIEGCPCCIEGKGVDVLLSKPLREISPEELCSYASSAFLTVGSVADYLYFLPRILEVSVMDSYWWPEPEITGRAMAETQPLTWRQDRRQALHAVLAAQVQTALADADWGTDLLDTWLCAISRAGLSVRPYLGQIETSRAHVAGLYSHNAEALEKGGLANAFWEDKFLSDKPSPLVPGHGEIMAWLRSGNVRKAVYEELGIVLPAGNERIWP